MDWGYLEKVLIEGQEKGVIRKGLDPKATALLIHDFWMGASLRMQVERSVASLRSVVIFLRGYLPTA